MRHLVICNVGPVNKVDIDLLRFNFFIGPQSSGKSTIAKVLSTCMWLEKEAATTLTEHLTYSSEEFVALIEDFHKIQGYFCEESTVDYVTDAVVLHYDKKNALTVRGMTGPTNSRKAAPGTIRGDFGMSFQENIIHTSDSPENAVAEINRFFNKEEIFEYKLANFQFLYANDEF